MTFATPPVLGAVTPPPVRASTKALSIAFMRDMMAPQKKVAAE